jgi:hypothetical protein
MAASMAPNDPLTHWRIAQVSQKTTAAGPTGTSHRRIRKAVSLSPNDYRFWMSLGTAHEQAGDPVKAELALKRAVAARAGLRLSTLVSRQPLLRNARYDEALPSCVSPAEADPELQPQQFNLIWEIYSDDPEGLKKAVGAKRRSAREVCALPARPEAFDDGLRLWDGSRPKKKKANKEIAEFDVTRSWRAQVSRRAAKFGTTSTNESTARKWGKVFDGSFEEVISYGPEMVFGWQVKARRNSIGIDPNKSHVGLAQFAPRVSGSHQSRGASTSRNSFRCSRTLNTISSVS